jgi:hypothetical protein
MLIAAWVGAKGFRPKAEVDQKPDDDFHGQQRHNDTHRSTTDRDARLMREGVGKEARLSFGAQRSPVRTSARWPVLSTGF